MQALGLCAVVAICYYAEQVLVVILASVLIAFVLAPVVDLFMRLRLPRWISSLLALLLLMSALGGVTFTGSTRPPIWWTSFPAIPSSSARRPPSW